MTHCTNESTSEYFSATESASDDDQFNLKQDDIKIHTIVRKPRNTRNSSKSINPSLPNGAADVNPDKLMRNLRKTASKTNKPKSQESIEIIDSDDEFERELLASGFQESALISQPILETINNKPLNPSDSNRSNDINTPPSTSSSSLGEQVFTGAAMGNMEFRLNSPKMEVFRVQETPQENDMLSSIDSKPKNEKKTSPKKKKRNPLMDDFFAIGAIETKRKKKKKRSSDDKSIKTEKGDQPNTTIAPTQDECKPEELRINNVNRNNNNNNNNNNNDDDDENKNKINNNLDLDNDIQILNDNEQITNSKIVDDDDLVLNLPSYSQSSPKKDQSENSRPYIIHLISKISPHNVELATTGQVKFSESVREVIPYNQDTTTLVWVEGKTEIRSFFKPSTLRIEPSDDSNPTKITLLLIPKDKLENFLEYPEFGYDGTRLMILDRTTNFPIDEDKDEEIMEPGTISGMRNNQSTDVSDYFVIGLKGCDNKRLEVQVSLDTSLKNVLEYYLDKKKIDLQNKKAKLIFDDEELELNKKVGDTELEEDFEVQVVIN